MKILLMITCLALLNGCAVYEFGQVQAWKAEVKYCDKYINGDLKKELSKAVEKGDLTQKQADKLEVKVLPGLEWLKLRAETKLSERKQRNASE